MRAVIYARFSSKNQKELSIDGQLRECVEYCHANDYDVVDTYVDRAKSGRYDSREKFLQMMDDAKLDLFDVVIVYKLNRFFRNRDEAALCRRELRKGGVKLLAARDPIPEGRGGIYYEAFLDADAEAYSVGLAEDTARGMLDAAMNYQVTGPLPLGYRSVPINPKAPDKGRRAEVDPAEAEIVRRAFELYAEGKTMPEICALFNNEGLTTKAGRKFQVTSLSAMFRNTKYVGIYKYKDVISAENGWPAIITMELFSDVAKKLKSGARTPQSGRATVEFFLVSKLFCGKCKKPMFGDSGSGRNGTHYYYSCAGRRKEKNCDKKPARKDVVEEAVFNGALNALTDENIAIIAAEAEQISRQESENGRVLAQLKSDLKETEAEIVNIGKAISAGIITETTKEMLEDAEGRRRDIRARIVREEVIAARVVTSDAIAAWLHKFRNGDRHDINFRRAVFDLLVNKVYLHDDEHGGYAIVWCNVAKGQEVRVDLSHFGSDTVQLGEPSRTHPNRPTIIVLSGVFGIWVPVRR